MSVNLDKLYIKADALFNKLGGCSNPDARVVDQLTTQLTLARSRIDNLELRVARSASEFESLLNRCVAEEQHHQDSKDKLRLRVNNLLSDLAENGYKYAHGRLSKLWDQWDQEY